MKTFLIKSNFLTNKFNRSKAILSKLSLEQINARLTLVTSQTTNRLYKGLRLICKFKYRKMKINQSR